MAERGRGVFNKIRWVNLKENEVISDQEGRA